MSFVLNHGAISTDPFDFTDDESKVTAVTINDNGEEVVTDEYYKQSRTLLTFMSEAERNVIFTYVKNTWLLLDHNQNNLLNTRNTAGNGAVFNGGRFVFSLTPYSLQLLPHKHKMEEHIKQYFKLNNICKSEPITTTWRLFISLSMQDQDVHQDMTDTKCFLTTFVPVTPHEDHTLFYDGDGSVISPLLDNRNVMFSFPGTTFHRGQRNKHDAKIVLLATTQDEKSAKQWRNDMILVFDQNLDKEATLRDIFLYLTAPYREVVRSDVSG